MKESKKTPKIPSFVAEFPLKVSSADDSILCVRFDAARQIYNAALGEALQRLAIMRESKNFKAACAMPKGKPRTEEFKTLNYKFDFTQNSIQKFVEQCRDSCWIKHHLGSHDTQSTGLRAFKAVQQYAFGKKGRPSFKQFGTMMSVEGKSNAACIRLRDNIVIWYDLEMPIIVDQTSDWQKEALKNRVKFVRVVKKEIGSRTRWYAQLVLEGKPPARDAVKLGNGKTGLDIGPSTIAHVSEKTATLEQFCPTVLVPKAKLRRIERALDRSRRATNPENYQANGTIKKGKKKWNRSKRYYKLAAKRRNIQRCLKSERKRSHGELQNTIIRSSDTVKTERVSYKAWQKVFGKSVGVRAPGTFHTGLKRKIISLGGTHVDIKTYTTKLSQYDHSTNTYIKKPLSQRIHIFGDGVTAPVQRDLYSAFLARFCDTDFLNASQVLESWPGAEPLLRQAALSFSQLPSEGGKTKLHVIHVRRIRHLRRQRKSSVGGNQNGTRGWGSRSNVVATPRIVRAPKSVPTMIPESPGF